MPDVTESPDPRLVACLRQAIRILIFTGAGISTASSIPDFRGPQGVWKRRQPALSLRLEGDVTRLFPPAVDVALRGSQESIG